MLLGGKIKRQYTLTDKANQKAIDSYNKYYNLLENNNITLDKKDAK